MVNILLKVPGLRVELVEGHVRSALATSRPLFSARLGITSVHLFHREGVEMAALIDVVIATVLRAQDGHAARELLNSWWTTVGQTRARSNVLDASGLAGTGLPGHLRERLENAVAGGCRQARRSHPAASEAR